MNILVVCQYYYPEPFKITELCCELVKKGYLITVLTGIPNYPEGEIYSGYGLFRKNRETVNDIEIIRIPIVPRGKSKLTLVLNYLSFAINGSLYTLFSGRKFDRVFIYQLSPVFMAIPGIIYTKMHKAPLILYMLDLWPDSFLQTENVSNQFIQHVLYQMSKWIYKQSSKIAVSSRGFIDALELMECNKKAISYIPQFADDASIVNPEIGSEYKKQEDSFSIIFAGNIGFAQGLDIVLDAAEITQDKAPNIRWTIVGNGRAKTSLQAACKDKKIGNVRFVGRVSSVEASTMIRSSDAALLVLAKSRLFSVTVPAKLQTYMSCGVPVLCAVDGEAARIIEDADAGLISQAGDAKQLAENAIKLSAMSKEQIQRYRNNSREYYMDHFTKDKNVRMICSLLN
jgi:glycosyltransferase involved in cell wall biosynthesis